MVRENREFVPAQCFLKDTSSEMRRSVLPGKCKILARICKVSASTCQEPSRLATLSVMQAACVFLKLSSAAAVLTLLTHPLHSLFISSAVAQHSERKEYIHKGSEGQET